MLYMLIIKSLTFLRRMFYLPYIFEFLDDLPFDLKPSEIFVES